MSAVTDDFTTDPWWWEAARPRGPDAEAPPASADVVVVGGGYTGLSAALTLAERGREVVVLDALGPGEAASSRNAGFLGRALLGGFGEIARKLGVDQAVSYYGGAEDAYAYTVALMQRLKIDCHLVHRGRLIPSWTPAQYDSMAAEFELQSRHMAMEGGMLSADELSQELKVAGASGGLLIANTSSVHPAMYHAGLLAGAERAGARVLGGCAVEAIRHDGDGLTLSTSRGTVQAREVVIATNAYTKGVTPWFRQRMIPTRAFMAATEPLDPALINRLLPSHRTYVDYSRHMFNFWREAPDAPDRLLFGGQTGFLFKSERDIAKRLQVDLKRIFPELEGTRFSHVWSGLIAFTMDRLPHLGKRDGLHFALGCNGAGMPMGTFIGNKVALKLLGDPEGKTPYDDIPFRLTPNVLGYPWYLPVLTAWARIQDARGIAASGH